MIRIESLSYGNWVYYPNVDNKPARIVSVSCDGIGIEVDNSVHFVGLGYISPLALSIEILEKNGFVLHDGIYTWRKGEDELSVNHYGQYTEISYANLSISDITETDYGCEITIKNRCAFVHELQNFITLVGVKKEIKL
jgi:hypothetical protein